MMVFFLNDACICSDVDLYFLFRKQAGIKQLHVAKGFRRQVRVDVHVDVDVDDVLNAPKSGKAGIGFSSRPETIRDGTELFVSYGKSYKWPSPEKKVQSPSPSSD